MSKFQSNTPAEMHANVYPFCKLCVCVVLDHILLEHTLMVLNENLEYV